MLKKLFCNPIILFVSVWILLLFLVNINAQIGLIYFNELTISLYLTVLSFLLAWIFGGGIAYIFLPVVTKYIRRFKIYSIDAGRSKIVTLILLFVYLFFRILDIFKTTGLTSIGPNNIEAYRYVVTEMGVAPNYKFINLLNPILFALPALIFYTSRKDADCSRWVRLGFFVAYILFVYLSSARSAAFVSLLILFFVMAYSNVKVIYLLVLPILMFFIFGIIGHLVGKSGYEHFFIYLLAPIHAFDLIINGGVQLNYPLLSFRPLHGLLYELGFLDTTFHLLEYVETPVPTNVYTIFGVYYNDFGFFGVLWFMFMFSFLSTLLHLAARNLASFRLMLLSSFYLSFIVLGVFYDYYTSSMFSFLAPILIILLVPARYSRR